MIKKKTKQALKNSDLSAQYYASLHHGPENVFTVVGNNIKKKL